MKNLLSLFKPKFISALMLAISVAAPLYALLRFGFDPVLIIFIVIAFILMLLQKIHSTKNNALVESLLQTTSLMANGKLESRIFPIDENAEKYLKDIAGSVNSTVDQMETFIREVDTVYSHVWNEQFYRSTLPVGLHGIFASILEDIDHTVSQMEVSYWEKQKDSLMFKLDTLRNVNLLENLKRNQKDLMEMAAEMKQVETSSAHSAESAKKSEIIVGNVLNSISQLTDSVQTMRDSTETLNQNSQEITEVTSFIAGVADKTNLLALNAAIEAARAGEAGRGFSVVADEVRKLAIETKEATDNITRIVKQVVNSNDTISGDMVKMQEISQNSHSIVQEFEKDFSHFAKISQDTLEVVSHNRMISFTTLAKLDHIIYIQKAYRSLETGKNSEEAKEVAVDDQHCRLGLWLLDDSSGKLYSHLPAYKKLQIPHQAVHSSTHKVQHIIEDDHWMQSKEQQTEIYEYFETIEANSSSVINLMDALVIEKKKYESSSTDLGEVDLF